MMPKAVERYLQRRAAPGPWMLDGCTAQGFRVAVVIPALAERESLPRTLEALNRNPDDLLDQTLIVVVVNNRAAANEASKRENCETLAWLATDSFPQMRLAWVDACRSGLELPQKDGVGLARKIGFDLALRRLDFGADPLLVSLDADTLVESDYLAAIFSHFTNTSTSGAFLPYRHQAAADLQVEMAIRTYELYLRSYQLGLEWAGSPYAFTAIGSALVCRASAYVASGGMKRRQGGEDFYFLQQLVKQGGVTALRGTLVSPSPRFSERVPFGTGRAVESLVCQGDRLFRFIPLKAFAVLRDFLQLIAGATKRSAENVLADAAEIDSQLVEFLDGLEFSVNWRKLQHNNPPAAFLVAWHNWFDGLRTRQLLQKLSADDRHEPQVLVAELLEAAGFTGFVEQADQLKKLEKLQFVPHGAKEE